MGLHQWLGAAAAALCLGALPSAGVAAEKPPCTSIQVTSPDEAKGKGRDTFSAAATSDLVFRIVLDTSLEGEHTLELKIFTPRDFLYRSIAVPIAAGATAEKAAAQRVVDGYPHPQHVRRTVKVKLAKEDAQAVDIALPVGGTDIVTTSLYGTWSAAAFLDGATKDCGAAAKFRITE